MRWSNSDGARLAAITLMVVVFQAMLGMWTVTWLLKPHRRDGAPARRHGDVRAAHLAGLAQHARTRMLVQAVAPKLRRLLWVGLALLAVQIALGGWTSSNYAALACGAEFPKCLGQWWPAHDFREAFVLWRGIGVDYEGGVLDGPARVAIQLAHRVMAVLVFGHLLMVALRMLRTPGPEVLGHARWRVLLFAQVALGIANVMLGLPLWVATAHTAGAALLLFVRGRPARPAAGAGVAAPHRRRRHYNADALPSASTGS